jgi:hypothetical protein
MYFTIWNISFIWFFKRLGTDNTFRVYFFIFLIHLLLGTCIRLKGTLLNFLSYFIFIFSLNCVLHLIEPSYLTIIKLFFILFYLMMGLMFNGHFFHYFFYTWYLLFNKVISRTRSCRWFNDIISLINLIYIKIH